MKEAHAAQNAVTPERGQAASCPRSAQLPFPKAATLLPVHGAM
jgi:hypothetical protein